MIKDECIAVLRDNHFTPALEELDIAVNQLPLPETLKIDLENLLRFMIDGVLLWLRSSGMTGAALEDTNQGWAETICYFVRHIVWNDLGFVDSQKILESYVSNKGTIPFSVWNQLCYHCSENDIMEFAKTFDWDNCKDSFESDYAVFWYHKIYGKFPAKEMFKSWYYKVFESNFKKRIYTDENIVKTLFDSTMSFNSHEESFPNISAMVYYHNYLGDEGVLKLLGEENPTYHIRGEVAFHLLRGMKKDILPKCISFCNLEFLLQWPWIAFIDDWINVFEITSPELFNWYFVCMATEGRKIERPIYKTLDGLCETVCRIFKRRFSSSDEIMRSTFWNIFSSEDIVMCTILFEGMTNRQRQFLIGSLNEFVDYSVRDHYDVMLRFISNEFRTKFYEEVARDDGERKLIPKILTPGVQGHFFQTLPYL